MEAEALTTSRTPGHFITASSLRIIKDQPQRLCYRPETLYIQYALNACGGDIVSGVNVVQRLLRLCNVAGPTTS